MSEIIDFSNENETHDFVPREIVHSTEITEAVIIRFVAASIGSYRLLGERSGNLWSDGYLQLEEENSDHVRVYRKWPLEVPIGAVFRSMENGEHRGPNMPITNIFGLELGLPKDRVSASKYYLPKQKYTPRGSSRPS
jgi:hypothetical protein